MRLNHSLAVIDDAVYRLGLTQDELTYLLEAEVEEVYLNRGKMVRARVNLNSSLQSIQVVELPPIGTSGHEILIRNPYQPNPASFLARVERFKKTRTSQIGWEVAFARCVSIAEDYSVMEIEHPPSLSGQLAVLPHNRLGANDRPSWRVGNEAYVVLSKAPSEHRDGLSSWYELGAKWLASRSDSVFLRRMIDYFLKIEPISADLYSGIGMVVIDEHADLGSIVGPGGENVKALQTLVGAKQIVFVRKLKNGKDSWRLKKAIQVLTSVKHFGLEPPQDEGGPWTIILHPNATKYLVGVNGCRLMFISRLAELRVRFVERTQFASCV